MFKRIFVIIGLIWLLGAGWAWGFGTAKDNADQEHGAGQSVPQGPQEITFVPAAVTINGAQVDPELVMSQLKMNCLSSTILHGPILFDDWGPKHYPEVLDQMIGRELLNREAVKAGIKVNEKEFEEVFRRNLDGLGGPEKVKGFFTPLSLSIDEYRSLSRHTYLARKYTQEILAPRAVSDDEARQYYLDNIDILSGHETLIYSYVGVRFIDKTDNSFLKNMKADSAKLKNTAGMKELAAVYKRTLGKRGVVAQVYRNEVDSLQGGVVFKKAAGIKPGSTIFFTNTKKNGEVYHIIVLVEEFSPRTGPTYDELKTSLKDRIIKEQTNNAINTKVKKLREAATIHVTQE